MKPTTSPTVFLMALAVLCLASLTATVEAFGVVSSSVNVRTTGMPLHSTKRDDEDFPLEETGDEYKGDVDWDAEWKKVVQKEKSGQNLERPGKDFYKSEAEITAIRAANKAQTEVRKISDKMPSAPSMDMGSLTGDWKVRLTAACSLEILSDSVSCPNFLISLHLLD